MAGFAKIPLVRGDTDDDASIHLHSHVGPSKPISYLKYDHQIMDILNETSLHRTQDDIGDEAAAVLNAQFQKFAENSPFDDDSGDDSTQVEDDLDEERVFFAKIPPTNCSNTETMRNEDASVDRRSNRSVKRSKYLPLQSDYRKAEPESSIASSIIATLKNVNIVAFFIGVALLLLIPFPNLVFGGSTTKLDVTGVNAKLDEMSQRVGALNEISNALDQQVDLVTVKHDSFVRSMHHKIEALEVVLQDLQKDTVDDSRMLRIEKELEDCKCRIDSGLQILSASPEDLENRINMISQSITHLLKLKDDITSIKESIIEELLQKLPEHVPVYVRDGKIHYLPEFHNFLVSFVSKHGSSSSNEITWKNFLQSQGTQIKSYMEELLASSNVKFVTKTQLEESLHDRLSSNNRAIMTKITSMLDKIDYLANKTNIDLEAVGNRVLLDNLVEVVGKGSIKVNFADYKLGARILGFLTTTGADSFKKKSLVRTVFLGWYDYLTSSGLRSPANMKFNANNVLVDGGQYWQCESRSCAIGVRLSNPIILTDLIFNNPSVGKPRSLLLPEVVSIYIKPRKRTDAAKLEQNLQFRQDFTFKQVENKFLSKFYKVQEVVLRNSRPTTHVKLPVSIVNMRIPIRDVYVEISSRDGFTGLYNLKAYGISEFNSFRFAENFESILDKLSEDSEQNNEALEYYHSGNILEDDYII